MKNILCIIVALMFTAPLASGASDSSESTTAPEVRPLDWMKPPPPIGGKWEVIGCAQKMGMIVEFVVENEKTATAKVVEPSGAAPMGYEKGQLMFDKLVVNHFGAFRGVHKWRSVSGQKRWDPIYLIMEGEYLTAKMTTDPCLSRMRRVP